jgi:hypothetical protein
MIDIKCLHHPLVVCILGRTYLLEIRVLVLVALLQLLVWLFKQIFPRTICWTNIVYTLLLLDICSLNVLLAHSIAVNTSCRSFGYYKPGHTSPHCIRLDSLFGESEESSLSPSTH